MKKLKILHNNIWSPTLTTPTKQIRYRKIYKQSQHRLHISTLIKTFLTIVETQITTKFIHPSIYVAEQLNIIMWRSSSTFV